MSYQKLRKDLEAFVEERDWAQFHNAKNFAASVCAEAGELMDHFVWVKDTDSDNLKNDPEKLQEIKDEAADVFMALINLSRHLDFDLEQALFDKIGKAKLKYPADEVKAHSAEGKSVKYHQLKQAARQKK